MLDAVLGGMLQWWLKNQSRQVRHASPASGTLQVHAIGSDADRVLLVLDRQSVGDGILSQELGLAGHLARQLSSLSRRGTDIDILANGNLTARACIAALAEIDLSRFDVVVLLLGSSEALSLTAPKDWTQSLRDLVQELTSRMPHRIQLVIVEIPPTRALIDFPRAFGALVDRRITRLNEATRRSCAELQPVTVLPFPLPAASPEGRNSSESFAQWARLIAPSIRPLLDRACSSSRPDEEQNEGERQSALDGLHVIGGAANPQIDRIVAATRDVFGATAAALTFLDNDRRRVKCAAGSEITDSPRAGSLCDLAIEQSGAFVIEDVTTGEHGAMSTARDFATGFYAGFPIEAPDGRRVGVLCVMDPRPRRFDTRDEAQLRDLALQIQSELWRI